MQVLKYLSIALLLVLMSCEKKEKNEVVIYTSVDQIFSEPVLKRFEEETGIKVKALYDVEASKTVGLVNRLIAEKGSPKCDVFWNSEVSRTIQLKKQDILQKYKSPHWDVFPKTFKDTEQYWTGFGARARVLIYNRDLLKDDELPTSIFELTDPKWRKKVTIAYPLFGTTATHVAAMYSVLGKEKTEQYLKDLIANDVVVVDGNGKTRDMVVEGAIPIGFTDTDDANVSIQQGKPVNTIYFDKEGIGTLLIPNTVAMVKSAPNEDNAKKLIDYLLSAEIESMLAHGESAQMPLRSGVKKPAHIPDIKDIKAMEVDYEDVATYIDEAAKFCQKHFVK